MDGVEMESVWMVTTLHSGCESNVTGGDGQHLRSHSFKCNDRGGVATPLPLPSFSLTFIVHLFQDQAQELFGGNCERREKHVCSAYYERVGNCWWKRLPVECF